MKPMEDYAIYPHCEAFYIMSMMFNCDSALDSLEVIDSIFEEMHTKEDTTVLHDNIDVILNNLQNIVGQGASLSRYFWPARSGKNKEHDLRAEQLRGAFAIDDYSPLKNRDLRNAIEHYDEKLDTYLKGRVIGNILPKYIGPEPARDGVPHHFFRAYFVDKAVFEILGHRLSIEPLIKEIYRIDELLAEFQQDMRLPRQEST